jgi:hypothetical protein
MNTTATRRQVAQGRTSRQTYPVTGMSAQRKRRKIQRKDTDNAITEEDRSRWGDWEGLL